MLDALAFLPVDDVADGTKHNRDNIPECGESQRDLNELVDYFDRTYGSGTVRRIQRPQLDGSIPILRVRRSTPLYPPAV